MIGDAVEGGHYSECPSLDPEDLIEGDRSQFGPEGAGGIAAHAIVQIIG